MLKIRGSLSLQILYGTFLLLMTNGCLGEKGPVDDSVRVFIPTPKDTSTVNGVYMPPPLTAPILIPGTPAPSPSPALLTYFSPFTMPVYDQNSTAIDPAWFPKGDASQSQLCGPAAAAMVLQTISNFIGTSGIDPNSWTSKNFLNPTGTTAEAQMASQIETMAGLVGTTVDSGTWYMRSNGPTHRYASDPPDEVRGISDRQADFLGGKVIGVATPENIDTNIHFFTDGADSAACCGLKQGFANVILIGHYIALPTTVLGKNFVTFSRFGGHYLPVSGYTSDSRGNMNLIILNPWYGQTQYEPVSRLVLNDSFQIQSKPYSIKALPNGAQGQGFMSGYNYTVKSVTIGNVVYNSEEVYELIEAYSGLSVPLTH